MGARMYPLVRLAILCLACAGPTARGGCEEPWFRRALVGLEVGPTGAQFGSDPSDAGYAARFDGGEIARACAAAGAEYLVMWARDGDYAYYDSRILPKPLGLGARDPLRESVEEGRRLGLPVIAYCVVQQGGAFLRAHPEFEMRGADGARIGRFCLNSGYLEAMKEILSEQLAYDIHGFHVDMLDQGFGPPYGCWCDRCRELFRARYGEDMPAGPTWDEGWSRMLEFRYDASERFEKALREHVANEKPSATVDFNYHGNPPFSWEVGQRPVQHAGNGDFITGETGVWGFSALGVGLNARFYAAATPGLPFQVAMQRGVRMYHDQTTRPLNDLRWELFTLLAHGAFVTIVDKTAYDGGLDPVAYERFGAAFEEARAARADFGRPIHADVAIYYSSKTRDWYAKDAPRKYQLSFLGAHKALAYEHVPWDVLLDENVTPERLRRFPVVMLPNCAVISDAEARLFRDYVEAGGCLLATGQTGLFDELGRPRETNALGDLIGARFVARSDNMDDHVRLGGSDERLATLADGIRRDWPFLVRGPGAIYEPDGADAIGDLMKAHRTVRQLRGEEGTDLPMSADAPVGPALLLRESGRGRVALLACSPDYAIASDHRVVEARTLLRNAIRLLHPAPEIEIDAPLDVEAVVTRDGPTRLLVHLLGYNSPAANIPGENRPYVLPSLVEQAPMYRATIRLKSPVERVAARRPTTHIETNGSRLDLIVEDVHECIEIETR